MGTSTDARPSGVCHIHTQRQSPNSSRKPKEMTRFFRTTPAPSVDQAPIGRRLERKGTSRRCPGGLRVEGALSTELLRYPARHAPC